MPIKSPHQSDYDLHKCIDSTTVSVLLCYHRYSESNNHCQLRTDDEEI